MGGASSLPDDAHSHIANFLPERNNFLDIRAVSQVTRDAVQRAIARRPCAVRRFGFYPRLGESGRPAWEPDEQPTECAVSSRAIAALGKVFGKGVVHMSACGRAAPTVAALELFVKQTNGGLETLELYRANIAPDLLLELCRACPRLKELRTPVHALIPYGIVEAIAIACPLIEGISVTNNGRDEPLSPAETWARHFPRLKALSFRNGWMEYRPTRLDAIRATALVTNATEMEFEGCHITVDVINALVGTPFGDRLERLGVRMGLKNGGRWYDSPTEIEPGAMLAAARGFPNLSKLCIPVKDPEGSRIGGPGFYVDLSRATTNLTRLDILDFDTTDACVAAACANLRLTSLALDELHLLTSNIVDGITRSQTATTLECLHIGYSAQGLESPLRAADLLRILQGCPKLADLNWFCDQGGRSRAGLDREPCQAIAVLMKSRGATRAHCSGVQDCIFQCAVVGEYGNCYGQNPSLES